jgi:ribosome recycling factor
MINEIKKDAQERMQKSIESLAAPGCDPYRPGAPKHPGQRHGAVLRRDTPLTRSPRSPSKTPAPCRSSLERNMLSAAVDKAIQSAGLNLNPTNLGDLLLSMPALTEETRKGFTKQASVC